MIIAVNGQFIQDKEAVISAYDHGFLYGIGLFETFRTYRGKPFLLEEHLHRLERAAEELWIDYRADSTRIRGLVERLLTANGLDDGYYRLSVSAGEEALGLPAGRYGKPQEVLYIKALPPPDERLYELGKSLQLLELPRNTPEGGVRTKSFHYMNNIMAKREMARYAWAEDCEGLFLTGAGHVAEGVVSNVFMIRGGICRTPSLDTGILPGITRAFVIDLAQRDGIQVEEGLYAWDELQAADELFMTTSIQEIVPVTGLYDRQGNRVTIGNGTAGPVTRRLLGAYRNACFQLG